MTVQGAADRSGHGLGVADRPWRWPGSIWRVVLSVAFVAPLWWLPGTPGRDLPQHVLMLVEAHRVTLAGPFEEHWACVPGSLFYWAARPFLSWLAPDILARLALSAYLVGTLHGMSWLAHSLHGRVGVAAAYGVLLLYNYPFYDGDLALLLGLPVLIAGLAILFDSLALQAAGPRRWTLPALTLVAAWLYLANAGLFSLFLIAWLIAGQLQTATGGARLGTPWAPWVVFLFGAFLALRGWRVDVPAYADFDFPYSDGFGVPLRWHWPTFDRMVNLAHQCFAIWQPLWGYVLWSIPVIYYARALLRNRPAGASATLSASSGDEWTLRNRRHLFLLFLALAAATLLWTYPEVTPLPGYLGGNRVFLWVLALLLLLTRGRHEESRAEGTLAWFVLPAVCLGCAMSIQTSTYERVSGIEQTLHSIPPRGKVLFLDFLKNDTGAFGDPLRFRYCSYQVRNGGATPFTFAWYAASPVKYRHWDLAYPPFGRPADFNRFAHGFGYDAIVALGRDDEIPDAVKRGLASWAGSLRRSEWGLVALSRPDTELQPPGSSSAVP